MKNNKLIDYLLGDLLPENDLELRNLLKSKGIKSEIAELSKQLENIAISVPIAKPSLQLKKSILSHIEKSGSEKFIGLSNRLAKFFQLPLTRINEILDFCKDLNSTNWDKNTIKGAYLNHFNAGGDLKEAHSGLIYLRSNTEITMHEHLGEERIFILQGEVRTNTGQTYKAGEMAVSKQGTSHSIIASEESDCIFAVIAIGGVKFENK